MTDNRIKITIRVDPELHRELKIECARWGWDLNKLINYLLANWLERMKHEQSIRYDDRTES